MAASIGLVAGQWVFSLRRRFRLELEAELGPGVVWLISEARLRGYHSSVGVRDGDGCLALTQHRLLFRAEVVGNDVCLDRKDLIDVAVKHPSPTVRRLEPSILLVAFIRVDGSEDVVEFSVPDAGTWQTALTGGRTVGDLNADTRDDASG